jgi:hypothetical protein
VAAVIIAARVRRELQPVLLKRARHDLERLRAWSPWTAETVANSIRWMAENGLGGLGRPIYGGRYRWWLIPQTTQAITYRVRGTELRVVRVRDLRRLRGSVPSSSPRVPPPRGRG